MMNNKIINGHFVLARGQNAIEEDFNLFVSE
jgi:hypothetical protein